jgi:hypothetical protein
MAWRWGHAQQGVGTMSNRFVVDLGDLKIDETAKRRIANAIQVAALGEIARLDSATSQPFAVFDPVRIKNPRWYGIWLRSIATQNMHPEFDRQIEQLEKFAHGQ